MANRSHRTHLFGGVLRFMLDRAHSPFAENKMGFNVACLERLKETDPQQRAGRPRYPDNNPSHPFLLDDAAVFLRSDSDLFAAFHLARTRVS